MNFFSHISYFLKVISEMFRWCLYVSFLDEFLINNRSNVLHNILYYYIPVLYDMSQTNEL